MANNSTFKIETAGNFMVRYERKFTACPAGTCGLDGVQWQTMLRCFRRFKQKNTRQALNVTKLLPNKAFKDSVQKVLDRLRTHTRESEKSSQAMEPNILGLADEFLKDMPSIVLKRSYKNRAPNVFFAESNIRKAMAK